MGSLALVVIAVGGAPGLLAKPCSGSSGGSSGGWFGVSDARVERGGATLEVQNGRLMRLVAGEDVVLSPVDNGPLGNVWDLAADPSGLTFVAADGGVFVAAPGVAALERVPIRDGAPAGAPRSVAMDGSRRLWVATENAVGAMDPSFGWGRCLPESDLPGQGPFALSLEGGTLEIRGTDGAKRIEVGGEAPAAAFFASANGIQLTAEFPAALAFSYGEVPEIEVTGAAGAAAAGDWMARYRVNGHHRLRSLDDDRALRDLAPGRHRLEVFGFDRYLRRTPPLAIELHVAAPFYYQKWFLLAAVGVLGAGIFGFFAVRASSRRTTALRVLGSSAILGALCLQVAAGIWPHAKGWPFVGYSMYSQPFDPSGHVHEPLLHFHDDKGRSATRSAYSMGLAVDSPWQVLHPLIDGNGPAIARMWEIMPALLPNWNVTSFQVVSERTKLMPTGPVPVPPLVLAHVERGESR